MTPDERAAMLQRLAADDPYWRGYLAGLNRKHEPPQTAGASSSQEDS